MLFDRAAEDHSTIYVFQAEPGATAQHTSSQEINTNQTDPIRYKLGIEWGPLTNVRQQCLFDDHESCGNQCCYVFAVSLALSTTTNVQYNINPSR